MYVSRDYRKHGHQIEIRMTPDEFRDTVEWLELLAPHDGCTEDWRSALDRIIPPPLDDD